MCIRSVRRASTPCSCAPLCSFAIKKKQNPPPAIVVCTAVRYHCAVALPALAPATAVCAFAHTTCGPEDLGVRTRFCTSTLAKCREITKIDRRTRVGAPLRPSLGLYFGRMTFAPSHAVHERHPKHSEKSRYPKPRDFRSFGAKHTPNVLRSQNFLVLKAHIPYDANPW